MINQTYPYDTVVTRKKQKDTIFVMARMYNTLGNTECFLAISNIQSITDHSDNHS